MSSDGDRRRPTREQREEAHAARVRQRRGRGAAAEGESGDGGPDGVPGPFGLLWSEPKPPTTQRGRGRGRGGTTLTRDEIVTAAVRLAAESGDPHAVSMRAIAAELGVGTMSLYHHVPTKDDLLDLMQDVVMGELVIAPDELPDNWRDALHAISTRTYEVYRRHPWMVAGGWERPTMGPRAFAHIEQSLSVFSGFPDLPIQLIGEFLGAADDYVIGFVTRQIATERAVRRAGLSADEYQKALEPYVMRLIEGGDFPCLRRFADEAWQVEDTPRFDRGLNYLLDGIAAALAEPR
jgi:AcrR family transcriptional regulator